MKAALNTIAILLIAPLASTAKSAPKTKAITLTQLVDIAMKKGESSTIEIGRAGSLGYPRPQPMMDYIVAEPTKDTQLAIQIVLEPETRAPKEIVLASTTVTEWSGETPVTIDGYSYRADLKGRLISMFRAHGKVGDVLHDKIKVDRAVKKHFEGLKSAQLNAAASAMKPE